MTPPDPLAQRAEQILPEVRFSSLNNALDTLLIFAAEVRREAFTTAASLAEAEAQNASGEARGASDRDVVYERACRTLAETYRQRAKEQG